MFCIRCIDIRWKVSSTFIIICLSQLSNVFMLLFDLFVASIIDRISTRCISLKLSIYYFGCRIIDWSFQLNLYHRRWSYDDDISSVYTLIECCLLLVVEPRDYRPHFHWRWEGWEFCCHFDIFVPNILSNIYLLMFLYWMYIYLSFLDFCLSLIFEQDSKVY